MLPPLLALAALTLTVPDPGDTTGAEAGSPRLLTDVARLGGATVAWAAINPAVRAGVLESGSLSHVVANFRSPIRRAIEGAREDNDVFTTNFVAHPVSWALIGLYLRDRGYSRAGALLFSQLHSITWEYVIEGSYMKPSGKDLLTNVAGAAVAIYWLHDRGLNPLRPLRGLLAGNAQTRLRLGPIPLGDRTTLGLILSRR